MEHTKLYLKVLALFVLLYMGSYYLLVEKQKMSDIQITWDRVWWELDPVDAEAMGISTEADPAYRWGDSTAEFVFRPIHWLDRRIRSDYWSEPEIISMNQIIDEIERNENR